MRTRGDDCPHSDVIISKHTIHLYTCSYVSNAGDELVACREIGAALARLCCKELELASRVRAM